MNDNLPNTLVVIVVSIVGVLVGSFVTWQTVREDWGNYLICVETTPERNCEAIYDAPLVDY